MPNKVLKLLFFALLFSLVGCNISIAKPDCLNNQKQVKLISDAEEYDFCAEIADDSQERSKGLMDREKLLTNEGMLFIFNNEAHQSFWMKNTLIPLDVLFFDSDFNLVDYKNDFQPCQSENCENYTSKNPAMYVLEIDSDVILEDNYKLEIVD